VKAVVIDGGVVELASAYQLCLAGCSVTLLESGKAVKGSGVRKLNAQLGVPVHAGKGYSLDYSTTPIKLRNCPHACAEHGEDPRRPRSGKPGPVGPPGPHHARTQPFLPQGSPRHGRLSAAQQTFEPNRKTERNN
jgi:hypothetical protein